MSTVFSVWTLTTPGATARARIAKREWVPSPSIAGSSAPPIGAAACVGSPGVLANALGGFTAPVNASPSPARQPAASPTPAAAQLRLLRPFISGPPDIGARFLCRNCTEHPSANAPLVFGPRSAGTPSDPSKPCATPPTRVRAETEVVRSAAGSEGRGGGVLRRPRTARCDGIGTRAIAVAIDITCHAARAARRALWGDLGGVRGTFDRRRPALEGRRRRQPRHCEDLLLVERLALEQRGYERVERLAVLREQPHGLHVALVDDALHLGVDDARGLLAERPIGSEAACDPEVRVRARRELHEPELIAHAPARDHVARDLGGLLDVVLRARGARAVHQLFCGASAEHADDPRAQVGFGIVVAVAVGALIGHAERLAARNDRHSVDGIGAGHDQTQDRVAALVIGDPLAVGAGEQERPLGPQDDLLERVHEVLLAHLVLPAPRREQRGFVDEVAQVSAREP